VRLVFSERAWEDYLQPMSKTTSVSLGHHFAGFIEEQVATGRYGSASDVVHAGLRLLEEQETRLKALQAALIEGEQSGSPSPFDFDAFLEGKRKTAPRAS
jgi:antitoxin ParD1/3/4